MQFFPQCFVLQASQGLLVPGEGGVKLSAVFVNLPQAEHRHCIALQGKRLINAVEINGFRQGNGEKGCAAEAEKGFILLETSELVQIGLRDGLAVKWEENLGADGAPLPECQIESVGCGELGASLFLFGHTLQKALPAPEPPFATGFALFIGLGLCNVPELAIVREKWVAIGRNSPDGIFVLLIVLIIVLIAGMPPEGGDFAAKAVSVYVCRGKMLCKKTIIARTKEILPFGRDAGKQLFKCVSLEVIVKAIVKTACLLRVLDAIVIQRRCDKSPVLSITIVQKIVKEAVNLLVSLDSVMLIAIQQVLECLEGHDEVLGGGFARVAVRQANFSVQLERLLVLP